MKALVLRMAADNPRWGHRTRRLHVAGITAHPDGAWSAQQARNLAMAVGERLEEMRFLIRDRGGQVTVSFDAVFEGCGLRILRSPPQAPRANAVCERLVGTCAASCSTTS